MCREEQKIRQKHRPETNLKGPQARERVGLYCCAGKKVPEKGFKGRGGGGIVTLSDFCFKTSFWSGRWTKKEKKSLGQRNLL